MPPNVQMISLDSYFSSADPAEVTRLQEAWRELEQQRSEDSLEFRSARLTGLLNGMPSLIQWGITIRDAWRKLYESQEFCSCLSTDQDNPYTKIPLLLAKRNSIPTLACHHGSLDVFMALTSHDADFYIAKSEMESDYMDRVCGIDRKKILSVAPMCSPASNSEMPSQLEKSWLVFFSEPYEASGWRGDEVYRDLLPHLFALAETCGLKLVFKLHPFETANGHRKLLLRHMARKKSSKLKF